jgi:hypothetical protein
MRRAVRDLGSHIKGVFLSLGSSLLVQEFVERAFNSHF